MIGMPNRFFKTKYQLIIAGILAIAIVIYSISTHSTCRTEKKIATVEGGSLHGIVEGGEQVKILQGYYTCHPIMREDIVEYEYAGGIQTSIIKIIKALPGDQWRVVSTEQDLYRIEVNGQVLRTSFGKPYEIDKSRASLLSSYAQGGHGVIPKGAYLILGNLPRGTTDSTAFGLVSGKDILGKVFLK